jgi:hypothetical protein
MQMLYNSDCYVVVHFDLSPGQPAADHAGTVPATGPTAGAAGSLSQLGFEIVDKRAGRETWLDGALAERFIAGAQALAAQAPTQEDCDDYIAGFADLAQQRLSLH